MGRPPQPGPTERELLLLKLLWEGGPSTVRDLRKRFPHLPKPAYTSLQTNLQGMLEKGYVSRTSEGKAHVYHAALSREEVEREVVDDLLGRVFDGSALRLISTALTSERVTPEEADALEALIKAGETRD